MCCGECTESLKCAPWTHNLDLFLLLLHILGPPILECGDPPVPSSPFINLDIGCDLCVQRGQSVDFFALDCTPDTRRYPTNCTIRNPNGVTARELDNGAYIIAQGNRLTINGAIKNPENPAPPTLLGDWTCTCVNENGVFTATSRIGECCKLGSFFSIKGNHTCACWCWVLQ